MKLDATDSVNIRRLYRIVRRDDFSFIAGEIVSADEATGRFKMLLIDRDGKQTEVEQDLGAHSITIVRR